MSCSPGLQQSESQGITEGESSWVTDLPSVGSYSSPRVADLNSDGVLDIIIGAGKYEFEHTDSAVVAISGTTGELLWNVPSRDQIIGSAALLDINGDGIKDVIINGRSAVLLAINGETGEVIWEFFSQKDGSRASDYGHYNFYNPQIIPDQTGDGLEDILISNGGDVTVEPHDLDRPPGKLMLIDAANGRGLVEVLMPDDKETYMSPVAAKIHEDDSDLTVIFGSGGETIGGNLYRTTLDEIMSGNISDAEILLTSENKGYIAPPVLADLTQDGYLDIIVNATEGRTIALDGKTNRILWGNQLPNVEAYASLGIGHFNDDKIPDIFTLFGEGVFPELDVSIQAMYDGGNGDIEILDTLGMFQTASPVVADFNNDGTDDALMSVNFKLTDLERKIIDAFHNTLVVYDFKNQSVYQLTDPVRGLNLASTPWIGDLNGNGKIDIIYTVLPEASLEATKVYRYATDIDITSEIKWGAYMGSSYNGIYE
jgi:outer membrane protein assembly factor BamB